MGNVGREKATSYRSNLSILIWTCPEAERNTSSERG
jgi:hypothetical protein